MYVSTSARALWPACPGGSQRDEQGHPAFAEVPDDNKDCVIKEKRKP